MVGAPGCGVDEAAGNARYKEAVVDLEFDGVLQGLLGGFKHAIKLLSLGDGAREAVKDESEERVVLARLCLRRSGGVHAPLFALDVVLELRFDHVDHDLVADQTARIHNLLRFPAKRRLGRDLRAQHVSGRLRQSAL